MWPAQFGRKLVLGTRRKWPRPRRDQDNFSPNETKTRHWYVSRPRRRDRDHNPGYHSLLFKFRTLCDFEPRLGDLTTTYDVHPGLIGKCIVDFLLVLIELYSLGVTTKAALQAKIDRKSAISLQRCQFDLKFQVEGVAPTSHFCTDS